jgi:hypothetical protein
MRKALSYSALPLIAIGGFVVGLLFAACRPRSELTAARQAAIPASVLIPSMPLDPAIEHGPALHVEGRGRFVISGVR